MRWHAPFPWVAMLALAAIPVVALDAALEEQLGLKLEKGDHAGLTR